MSIFARASIASSAVQFQGDAKIITIDGPSASGKSTVSRLLAGRLNMDWVSTGIFYRGIAYIVVDRGIDVNDEARAAELIEHSSWSVKLTPEKTLFIYEGTDVTELLQKEKIGNVASRISQFQQVRSKLLSAQRECGKSVAGLIAEGRDCGTVVFPSAQVKIYLTADQRDRASRRAKEEGASVDSIEAQQIKRDRADLTRSTAPLQIPADALVVDTTDLTLEQVVEFLSSHPRVVNFQ